MEIIVLGYVMLGFMVLMGAATVRLHNNSALAVLADRQVLLFSVLCTLFCAVLIVFWLHLFWLFFSVWYCLAMAVLAVVLNETLRSIHYQSTVWALLLVGIVGTLLMQVLYFTDYYPLAY